MPNTPPGDDSADTRPAESPTPDEGTRSVLGPIPEADGFGSSIIDPPPELLDELVRLSYPRVPGFVVEREIGSGGMGVVYLARHDAADRPVALKVLNPLKQVEQKALTRFLGEMEAVAAVIHPNVVKVYQSGQHDGRPYLALEYCAGGDLSKLVARGPTGADGFRRVAELMAGVAEGVNAAHVQQIIHRDLKPNNVLLAADGTPKVTDFGLAKRAGRSDLTKTGVIMGTPEYMSPEQATGGAKFVGPEADVWAVGVMLHELLRGEKLFKGAPLAVLKAVARADVPPLRKACPAVPADLALIVGKCLEKEAKDRYPTAGPLAADLRRWLGGQPISARPPGLIDQAKRWAKRNTTLAATVAGTVVGLVALAVALAWGVWERDGRLGVETDRANEERKRTQAERERAEAEQRLAEGARAQAHDATVAEARAHARRGDWAAAIAAYERAVADARPDAPALRVERLYGFFAVNDPAALDREFRDHLLDDEGNPRADLGPLAPRVDLIRGAYLLCDSDRQEDGRRLVRRALDRRDDLSSAADIAFAEALTQTKPRPTVSALRQAVAADPLHYPAQTCLCVALLASGQPAEAKAHAERVRELFPESEVPPLVVAIVAVLDGEPNPPASRVAPPEFLASLGELLRLADQIQVSVTGQMKVPDGFDKKMAELVGRVVTAGRAIAVPVPTIHLCMQWVQEFPLVTPTALGFKGLDAEYARQLARQADTFEAIDRAIPGINRFMVGTLHTLRNDPPGEVVVGMSAAADHFHAAAAAPTLLDRCGYRYACRCMGLMCDLAVLKMSPADDRERWRRVRDTLPRVVADGRDERHRALRGQAIDLFIKLVVAPPTNEQRADWKPDTDAGRAAVLEREGRIARLADQLLDDWAADDPKSTATDLRKPLADWVKAGFAPHQK